jgi:hypothetical protein
VDGRSGGAMRRARPAARQCRHSSAGATLSTRHANHSTLHTADERVRLRIGTKSFEEGIQARSARVVYDTAACINCHYTSSHIAARRGSTALRAALAGARTARKPSHALPGGVCDRCRRRHCGCAKHAVGSEKAEASVRYNTGPLHKRVGRRVLRGWNVSAILLTHTEPQALPASGC